MLFILKAFLQLMTVDIHPNIACHLGNVDPALFLMLQLNTCQTHAYSFDYIVPDLCLILWLSSCPSISLQLHLSTVQLCTDHHCNILMAIG